MKQSKPTEPGGNIGKSRSGDTGEVNRPLVCRHYVTSIPKSKLPWAYLAGLGLPTAEIPALRACSRDTLVVSVYRHFWFWIPSAHEYKVSRCSGSPYGMTLLSIGKFHIVAKDCYQSETGLRMLLEFTLQRVSGSQSTLKRELQQGGSIDSIKPNPFEYKVLEVPTKFFCHHLSAPSLPGSPAATILPAEALAFGS